MSGCDQLSGSLSERDQLSGNLTGHVRGGDVGLSVIY